MSPKLNVVESYGQPRRRDRVRVVKITVRGEPLVRVQWKEGEARKSQSFPDTRKGVLEAKAYAAAMSDRLAAKVTAVSFDSMSVREIFERHITAKMDSWRPKTLANKKERWQQFELFIGRSTPAHLVTREHLDEFKRAMVKNKRAINQVKLYIENAMSVFRWAVDRDLIPPTKVTSYKIEFGRDAKRDTVQMAEYSGAERTKILAELDPRAANTWRAWVLTTLFGYCGPRENAALHLEWTDVRLDEPQLVDGDLVFSGAIRWNPELDKMGHERIQPLPSPVAEAMWVAYGWRLATGYSGRWVFFGARKKTLNADRPYTFQAYTYALHEAEKRAAVPHIKYRGAHGFRRGISGDIYDLTGSEHKAAEWIGDRSVKIVKKHYLLEREDRQKELAHLIGKAVNPSETK